MMDSIFCDLDNETDVRAEKKLKSLEAARPKSPPKVVCYSLFLCVFFIRWIMLTDTLISNSE